jgi:hypothetical protein
LGGFKAVQVAAAISRHAHFGTPWLSLLTELPPPPDPESEAQDGAAADELSGIMTGRDQLRADDYIRPYIDENDSDVED